MLLLLLLPLLRLLLRLRSGVVFVATVVTLTHLCTIADVPKEADGPGMDKAVTKQLLDYAESNGYVACFITVDQQTNGNRWRTMRDPEWVAGLARTEHGGLPPPRVTEGLGIHATANGLCSSVTWEDVEWMGTQTGLPLVLKGVGRAEDALRAAEMPAVKGIVVSNHGTLPHRDSSRSSR